MWLYLIILCIPLLVYASGGEKMVRSKSFLVLYMTFLAFFVGMSDMLGGYDRYIYGAHFDDISDKLESGISWIDPMIWNIYEKGYLIVNVLFAHITHNRYIFILGLTLLIYFNFYIGIKRHAENYPFALIVFLGLFFFFSFTYLRQVTAVSIALLSIKYLIERKSLKFFLMILLVATFHKSGIFFSILYFIPVKKFSRSTVIFFLLLCWGLGLSGIASFIFDTYIDAVQAEFQLDYASDSGVRFAYFIEAVVFVAIILYNYDKISTNRKDVVFLNMALLFCATLLIFIRSSNGGRLSWYFIFGIIVTFTTLISKEKSRNSSLKISLIGLFFLLYFRVLVLWGVLVYPYKTFLTNGHRPNDPVYEQYEYDNGYDINKMYRTPFVLPWE